MEGYPREPRDDRRDVMRDEGDARKATATLIVNRTIEMHQRKMRRLYIVEATPDKFKIMTKEQLKLCIQKAKTMYEFYDYLWSIMEDSDS